MLAQEPIDAARYALEDTEKVTFSDNEMLAKLNNSLEELYIQLGAIFSPLLEVEIPLVLTDGAMELPSDFHVLGGVYLDDEPVPCGRGDGKYRIVNNEIRCDIEDCVLRYVRFPDALTSVSDEVPLPSFFRPLLRDMIVASTKDDPGAVKNLAYGVRKLVGQKQIGSIPELQSWR